MNDEKVDRIVQSANKVIEAANNMRDEFAKINNTMVQKCKNCKYKNVSMELCFQCFARKVK